MDLSERLAFDISPRLSPRIAVFPGDEPFSQKISLDFSLGHHLRLSSVTTSLHVGAHADAPGHYAAGGGDSAGGDLKRYMGRCQVVTATKASGPDGRITWDDLPHGWQAQAPRVLFRTLSFPDPECWNPDFFSLDPQLVDALADSGVFLVGIDTPSIDPETCKALRAHGRVAAHGMSILEGLVLNDVPDGLYELIALPLAIEEGDASPVRAVLLNL